MYYEILRNKKFVKPYMQNVWYHQTHLESLLFEKNWKQVYNVKIKKLFSRKLAEFNYKLLNGSLPCGVLLSKWIKTIPSRCTVCDNVNEDIKHMLFDCGNVRHIWEIVGSCFNIRITWKSIVIGYYENINQTMSNINTVCNIIAYSIFKENNRCKWDECLFTKYNVNNRIIRDLEYICKLQLFLRKEIVNMKKIKEITNCISN